MTEYYIITSVEIGDLANRLMCLAEGIEGGVFTEERSREILGTILTTKRLVDLAPCYNKYDYFQCKI